VSIYLSIFYAVVICLFSVSESELSPAKPSADHHVLRTVNALRTTSRGELPTEHDVLDEFGILAGEDTEGFGEDRSHSHRSESSALEFKPRMKKLPMPSTEEKKLMRDRLFNMMDSNREEESRLQSAYDALREEGGKAAERAAEELYQLQRSNAVKLRDFIDEYQPEPFTKSWGNDPDYLKIHSQLKEALVNDNINVKKMIKIEAGIVKKKKKKPVKSKSKKASTSLENDEC
jgi:hypothetical protein